MKNNPDKKTDRGATAAIPRKALETLLGGFEMYSDMTRRLLEVTRPSSQTGSEEEMQKRLEAFMEIFQELFELLPPSMKIFNEAESAMGPLDAWQRFVKSTPAASLPMMQLSREIELLADHWQAGTLKLFNDWNDCLRELAGSYQAALSRGDDPRRLWITSMTSYEKFYNALIEARFSFVTEHMKALFKVLQSFLTEASPPAMASQKRFRKKESVRGRESGGKEK